MMRRRSCQDDEETIVLLDRYCIDTNAVPELERIWMLTETEEGGGDCFA
jgi:hypothetical protein